MFLFHFGLDLITVIRYGMTRYDPNNEERAPKSEGIRYNNNNNNSTTTNSIAHTGRVNLGSMCHIAT